MQAECKLIFDMLVDLLLLVKSLEVISIESIKAVLHIIDRLCVLLDWSLDWNWLLWDRLSNVLRRDLRDHIT